MNKIFITGVTGFLGSNIAQYLLEQKYNIIATYRSESSKELCSEFVDEIHWILQDDEDEWIYKIASLEPKCIIHCAWIGVTHQERDDWELQLKNLDLLRKILSIAKNSNTARFIALGSQAEYGQFDGCINENYPLKPTHVYGRVKIICSEIVKQYCKHNNINWYWLRLFSLFGKGESLQWLLPSLVVKIFHDESMDLTEGEQKYSYLYAKDLGRAINKIISGNGSPGIYNISSENLITIKELIRNVTNKINPNFNLNFGVLPYRANQSMHLQGDSSKFVDEFGEFALSDFDQALSCTIEDLIKRYGK